MVDYANGAETLGALTLRRMDAPSAREIANWRYAPPHGIYNCAPGKAEEAVEHLLNPEHRCFSVWDDAGSLVGCLGFGDDGGVPGGDHSASALDLGGGLRPDRTGQGLGASLIQAALAFGSRHRAPVAFRATVAAFGRRALQVWARAGCCQVGSFAHAGSREPFEETFEGQVTFRRLKHALQRAALPVLHSPAGASKATARAVLQETSDWHARDL